MGENVEIEQINSSLGLSAGYVSKKARLIGKIKENAMQSGGCPMILWAINQ